MAVKVGTEFNDTIDGDPGEANLLFGFEGDDLLRGSTRADALDGGDGNDVLIGRRFGDTMVGGAGSDTFRFEGYDDLDVSFLSGDIILDADPGDVIDLTDYFPGLEWIGSNLFSPATEEFAPLEARQFDLTTVNIRLSNDAYKVLRIGGDGAYLVPVAPGSLLLEVLAIPETVLGAGADTYASGATPIIVDGLAGDDSLYGGGASDGLIGGAGNDTLDGGAAGDDAVWGGAGADLFVAGADSTIDLIVFGSLGELGLGAGADTVLGVEFDWYFDFSEIDWSAEEGDQAFTIAPVFDAPGQLRWVDGRFEFNMDADAAAEFEIFTPGSVQLGQFLTGLVAL